ncbi:tRNA (adenosine(37)-N6)-threonylcarbamoyltransferase complex dimerization subunit type 1 TsaB [Hippea alviniae]|uniref:tRNA (adenosine(37)-N6)-threonylcarbamoyltransferase complex dimerization subunit type 1 TsaB n=1 Tax=Hippea alviniae TaxID=1279027 RepID=UPI0003B6088A|nr:tRNA (adenosine(37)-N6)-threonylcarbamoyltransferase complex dimerization subunit type 1 TsaB [Hippea alviniae]
MQLAVDGSGNFLDISLFNKEGELVYSLFLKSKKTHSKQLVDVIDTVLKQLDISLGDIDTLFCVVGPGRYTSIRVVISTLKGLFFQKSISVFSLNSLDITAASVCDIEMFRVIGDFFSKEAYYCDYERKSGQLKRVSQIKKGTEEDVNDTGLPIIRSTDVKLFPKTKHVLELEQFFEKVELFALNPFY